MERVRFLYHFFLRRNVVYPERDRYIADVRSVTARLRFKNLLYVVFKVLSRKHVTNANPNPLSLGVETLLQPCDKNFRRAAFLLVSINIPLQCIECVQS